MAAPPSSRTFPPTIGPFRLIACLGQGGFAPVWHAEEVYEGRKIRDVAVKLFFLPEGLLPTSAEAARWLSDVIDEASALCRVEHSNVVRFHTLLRDDAHGIVGLVMEYVAGKDLGSILRDQGPLEQAKVLEVGISVAWALAAVHNAGLVHRDVKPENIIEAASGYKLIDFGIVVNAPREDLLDEARPSLIGTLGYVAPEYLQHRAPPSPGGDLYAFGVTLFALATGNLPPLLVGAPHFSGTRPSQFPVSRPLLDLIRLLLDPDPNSRPRHADWVARELEGLRGGLGALAEPSFLFSSSSSAVRDPSMERLFSLERTVPELLAPLFAEVRRASEEGDLRGALQELGLGVLRYAFALGMAFLASAPTTRLMGTLGEPLRVATRAPNPSWLSLLRAIHEALSATDPAGARLFAFAAGASLANRLDALLHDQNPAPSAWARWLADLFEDAAALLSIRRATTGRVAGSSPSHAAFGDRQIRLNPWIRHEDGQRLLPELPVAPGKPWRAADLLSGERRDDIDLDRAMRRLLGEDEREPSAIIEPDPHPPLIGRDDALAFLERAALESQRGGLRLVLLTGPLGIGRTRLLEAAIEQAGVAKERTLRTHGSPERPSPLRPLLAGLRALPHGGAFRLLEGALERALAPAVLPTAQQGDEALEAVEDALLAAAAEEPVIFALDDVQWADERTLKLLHLLIERADRGARVKLLVLVTARDEPRASAPLRAFLGALKGRSRPSARHLALGPLTPEQAAALAQGVCPLNLGLERAVVRGSGCVPFFLVNALLAWRETGAIVWSAGAFRAVDDRLLDEGVPGVAALLEARLASYFAPNSPRWRSALRTLAAVALHGNALSMETLFEALGEDEGVEDALEALVDAGILVVAGESQEYGFAQEMVRQAALNLVRQRPWFRRLHRALLDAIAKSPEAAEDAAFLAAGYEKLGDRGEARAWLARAMESAARAGLFDESMRFGDRLAALAPDPATRADIELRIVRALVQGRQFEEAKARLERVELGAAPGDDPRAAVQDLRRRILRLEVARGRSEVGEDADLISDADALGDPALACEARMALAGVTPAEQAMELIGETVDLAERCDPALEFHARVLRFELTFATSRRDLHQAERDLRRALAIARATSSIWQEVHIEGDLAALETELGRTDVAIERLRRLAGRAEELGMTGQRRTLLNNLSACLMREGRAAEAGEVARQTADLAREAGDPTVHGLALSLQAYALFCTGDLETALASATEAEWLQREREDRARAQTLLRRAAILEAMGREDEALEDAQAAQVDAEFHGERGFYLTAVLWEKLYLARRGAVTAAELREALAAVESVRVGQRTLTRRLVQQAAEWLARATAPISG
ncbi:MAG TPA: protein kinase [Polyangiaceae bacterium]|nr:protein kinase [Polyangiaceae bacterium]